MASNIATKSVNRNDRFKESELSGDENSESYRERRKLTRGVG